MKLTDNEIKERIYMFVQNAHLCNDFDDNEGVLKCLFMIEFYKDFLEA
jgi:hypothetical protein